MTAPLSIRRDASSKITNASTLLPAADGSWVEEGDIRCPAARVPRLYMLTRRTVERHELRPIPQRGKD